jgi:hypothetical protein
VRESQLERRTSSPLESRQSLARRLPQTHQSGTSKATPPDTQLLDITTLVSTRWIELTAKRREGREGAQGLNTGLLFSDYFVAPSVFPAVFLTLST